MRIFLITLFVSLTIFSNAQKTKGFSAVDKIALQIPDSLTKTTLGIASYINSTFENQTDKSRAIFIWIAKNIQYDVPSMFSINFYESKEQIINEVLKTKIGICMHYAELFNAIANQTGIKSYVISGYTKQNGFVDYIAHSWCACYIDSSWYLFDPTWGSGYISDSRFYRKINNLYFKAEPEQLIKSHMPFDPLWQFLKYPVTSQEFYLGRIFDVKTKSYFNFIDTLKQYEQESEIEKLVSSSRRIEANGVKNSITFDRLQHNKREIEYYFNNQKVNIYNSAVSLFNEGVHQLNRFIHYRNNQFTPPIPDDEIKLMLDSAEMSLNNAKDKLKEIKNPDSNNLNSINQLNNSIDETFSNLNSQKAFLEEYFNTNKKSRKSLFRIKK